MAPCETGLVTKGAGAGVDQASTAPDSTAEDANLLDPCSPRRPYSLKAL